MRSTDGYYLNNVAAGTYGPFTLAGGIYHINTAASGSGSVDLEILALDGVTGTDVMTTISTTTGQAGPLYLAPGQYQIIIAGFTANYVALTRVPLD